MSYAQQYAEHTEWCVRRDKERRQKEADSHRVWDAFVSMIAARQGVSFFEMESVIGFMLRNPHLKESTLSDEDATLIKEYIPESKREVLLGKRLTLSPIYRSESA